MANLTPRAMIERLVGFDTVSSGSNLALIEFAANHLDGLGIKASLVHNAERTKANLFATIGPDAPGGACLSGHTDVVPVAGQPWDTDPFKIVEKDGSTGAPHCIRYRASSRAATVQPQFVPKQ